MRIDPAQIAGETSARDLSSGNVRPAADPPPADPASPANKQTASPASLRAQQAEQRQAAKPRSAEPFPEDEVRVQWDKELKNEVIYQVLDKQWGNVVLQMPSEQVLGVAHEIQASLHAEVSKEESAPAASSAEGKKNEQH